MGFFYVKHDMNKLINNKILNTLYIQFLENKVSSVILLRYIYVNIFLFLTGQLNASIEYTDFQ